MDTNDIKKVKNVLICDDDEDLLFLASSFLSRKKITVFTASTGEEALKIYSDHKNNIDIVVLDHTFKNSTMQGEDILIELKKRFQCKVVISSGYPKKYFAENYAENTFKLIDGFVDKNYSSPSFVTYLENVLNDYPF